MRQSKTLFLLTAGLIFISLFMAACQGRVSTVDPTATSIEDATRQAMPPTPIPPTATDEPPTRTPRPTHTPTVTDTPLPTATDTPDLVATAQVEAEQATLAAQIEQATVDAAVQATVDALPTDTPYPTYTVEPSDTPTDTPEPTLEPTVDAAATQSVEQTQQAELALQVEQAVAATVDAQTPYPTYTDLPSLTPIPSLTPDVRRTLAANQSDSATATAAVQTIVAATVDAFTAVPSQTPYPTYTEVPSLTPTDTPEPTLTPVIDTRATQVAIQQQQATDAAELQNAVAATVEAYTAVPSQTPYPTYTVEPSATPSDTPEPTLTPTIDVEGTQAVEQTQQADFAAQVNEAAIAIVEAYTAVPSQTALPTHTPYPTYTVEPSATPSATPELTLTPTVDQAATQAAEQTQQADFAAQVHTAVAATVAAFTAVPSQTPYPTDTAMPSEVPTETATFTVTPSVTFTPSPMVEATLTFTRTPSLTPSPTDTSVPPTQAVTLPPTDAGPTPDLFASATAQAQFTRPTVTMSPIQMTATRLVGDATATMSAQLTAAPPTLFPYEQTATQMAFDFAQTPTLSPYTPDFAATATQIVANATASAEAILAAQQITVTMPEGWQSEVFPNKRWYSDGAAQVFVYSGDAAYFAQDWGLPADVTTLPEAAAHLAARLGGTAAVSELENVTPINFPPSATSQGIIYLVQTDGQWVIVSANAPLDSFETYRVNVFEPAALSVTISVAPEPTATLPPTPAPPTLAASATATGVPYVMTMTQMSIEWTLTATYYVEPTASATYTPSPVPSLTPSPTATPSPQYDLTATVVVAAATETAQAIAAQPFAVQFTAPAGWDAPFRVDANTVYMTNNAAQVFVYAGDAAYFAERWGIPADTTDLEAAASALATTANGLVMPSDQAHLRPILLTSTETAQGIMYLAQIDDAWVIVSASASLTEFDAYHMDVFIPLVQSLAAAADTPPVEPPAAFVPYSNETLGLAFDAPDGWTAYIDPSLNLPSAGAMAVFFFANPANAEDVNATPTDPAIFLLRIDAAAWNADDLQNVQTPEELLAAMFDELPADQIKPFDAASFPAARALIAGELDEELDGVIYALRLGDTDWLIVALVAPKGANVPLLDETILMPVIRSVQVTGPMQIEDGPPPLEPTAAPAS